jgi:ribosomal protein S18 acetylase RimI-like enzyme
LNDIIIREAAFADAAAIAALHVVAWRQAYGALAPAGVEAIVDEAYRLKRWSEKLSVPIADQLVLVAEQGDVLVGFGAAGAPSEKVFAGRGEIKFLYIDPDLKRRGIGRRLLSALALHLRQSGYTGAALGVVESNEEALAFYQALGGRVVGRYVDPGPIWRSDNLVVAWEELARLIA